MCAQGVVVLLIGRQNIGRLSEDSASTDGWTRVGSGTATERGSRTQPPKVTMPRTSAQACTTTDEGESGSERAHTEEKSPTGGMSRTDGKAAGVSTNEGGVEPGPIAHRPR